MAMTAIFNCACIGKVSRTVTIPGKISKLFEDVPALVRQYLREHAGESDELDAAAAALE